MSPPSARALLFLLFVNVLFSPGRNKAAFLAGRLSFVHSFRSLAEQVHRHANSSKKKSRKLTNRPTSLFFSFARRRSTWILFHWALPVSQSSVRRPFGGGAPADFLRRRWLRRRRPSGQQLAVGNCIRAPFYDTYVLWIPSFHAEAPGERRRGGTIKQRKRKIALELCAVDVKA